MGNNQIARRFFMIIPWIWWLSFTRDTRSIQKDLCLRTTCSSCGRRTDRTARRCTIRQTLCFETESVQLSHEFDWHTAPAKMYLHVGISTKSCAISKLVGLSKNMIPISLLGGIFGVLSAACRWIDLHDSRGKIFWTEKWIRLLCCFWTFWNDFNFLRYVLW